MMWLLLAILFAHHQEEYVFRAFPIASLPGADITLIAENVGPLTEANYCLGIEITWPNETKSTYIPDCPSWDEYQRQQKLIFDCSQLVVVCPDDLDCFYPECRRQYYDLQRRWTIHTRQMHIGFNSGDWDITCRFLLPNHRHLERSVTIHVAGGV